MKTAVSLLLTASVAALANGAWMPEDPFTGYPLETLTRDNVVEAITSVWPFDFTVRTTTEVGGYVGDDLAHGYQTLFYTFDESGRPVEISFLYCLTDVSRGAIENLVEVADYYKPRAMSVGNVGSTFELVIDPENDPRLEIVVLVP